MTTLSGEQLGNSSENIRTAPVWVSFLAVILVIGGAGWFVWSTFFSTPSVGKELEVGNFPRTNFRIARPPPPIDGISAVNNLWRIQSGEFFMTLGSKVTALVPVRVYYSKPDLLTPEQIELISARRQIVVNNDLARELAITPEQVQKLAAIPLLGGQGLKLEKADQEKLSAQWQDWQNARDASAKKAAEKTLLSTLKDVGVRSVGQTRQQFAQRADEIKSVLTAEQLQKYHARPR